MEYFLKFLNKSFGTYNIKGIYIEPTYWQAGVIVLLIFLMVLVLARMRHLFLHWSISKPAMSMIFWGFVLAIIAEGFLILGGNTLFTEILGWEKAPKPISNLLDITRRRVVKVLGETDANYKSDIKDILGRYQNLSEEDAGKLRDIICTP